MASGAVTPQAEELLLRQGRLQAALADAPADPQLKRLLAEVDGALARVAGGTYGLCEECHEPIERERLLADPLVRFCLDHLTPDQQQALEDDLALAARIQARLLPPRHLQAEGWEAVYHYRAAGLVSGDYCDLLSLDGSLHFVVGDVSGKGIPAAMLMANLQATLRVLVGERLPLTEVMEKTSRIFCESTLPTHFATLVCGKAEATGEVAISLAGHQPALLAQGGEVLAIGATGLPLGLFCDERFAVSNLRLRKGDTLVVFTDGVSESLDPGEREYGVERLADLLRAHGRARAAEILAACVQDLESFRVGAPSHDDETILVLQRR